VKYPIAYSYIVLVTWL